MELDSGIKFLKQIPGLGYNSDEQVDIMTVNGFALVNDSPENPGFLKFLYHLNGHYRKLIK